MSAIKNEANYKLKIIGLLFYRGNDIFFRNLSSLNAIATRAFCAHLFGHSNVS